MGHKVNPLLFRLGYTVNWTSRWYGDKNFPELLKEDSGIRKILAENLKKASVEKIVIDRASNVVTVSILSGRPGVIIGRGGTGIEDLRKLLKEKLGLKKEVKIDVIEVKDPESSAAIIGQEIASQIERRIGWKRAIKRMLETVMSKKGVQGIKIAISGRLDGAEMGRREWLAKGKIPLHTLRSNIDFTRATAFTTYGAIGIKVWVYKGEVFDEKSSLKKQKINSK